ncbi:hypothetical protein GW17_00047797 [Ensete ventricosum]|nr:hypothetical protein GW17_00047797 [Ensete ventricosum]
MWLRPAQPPAHDLRSACRRLLGHGRWHAKSRLLACEAVTCTGVTSRGGCRCTRLPLDVSTVNRLWQTCMRSPLDTAAAYS